MHDCLNRSKHVQCFAMLCSGRFEIILRNIEAASPDVVKAAAEGLRQSGFVNYFGLQRFGSGAVPTHRLVGAGGLAALDEWRASRWLHLQ